MSFDSFMDVRWLRLIWGNSIYLTFYISIHTGEFLHPRILVFRKKKSWYGKERRHDLFHKCAFKTWWKKSVNSKIKIVFIVWSQCILHCFKSYTNKLPIFKIEYIYSYNLFFGRGVGVFTLKFHWDSAPSQHSEPIKESSAVMLHFLMHNLWI